MCSFYPSQLELETIHCIPESVGLNLSALCVPHTFAKSMDIPQYPLQNSKGNTFGTVSLIPDDIEYGYSNNPFQFPTLKDLQLAYGYDVPGTQLVPDPKANNYTINNQPSGQCIRREPKHDSDTRSSTKTASCGNAEMRWDSSHDKRLTKRWARSYLSNIIPVLAKLLSVGRENQGVQLRCRWEGCEYTGTFSRESDLLRHLKTVHICKDSYCCPVEGCQKVSNRCDNMKEHIRRVHQRSLG